MATNHPTPTDLAEPNCADVLNEAIDYARPAEIVHAESRIAAWARITELSENHIQLELPRGRHGPDQLETNDRCVVRVVAGSKCYEFDSTIVAVHRTPTACTLSLKRPGKVRPLQRRRFRRAKVRKSTTVALCRTGQPDAYTANILNVSADGLACRLDNRYADTLSVGERLCTVFTLEDGPEAYHVDAVIKGKTPAATSECTIMRLQFDHQTMPRAIRTSLLRSTQPKGDQHDS